MGVGVDGRSVVCVYIFMCARGEMDVIRRRVGRLCTYQASLTRGMSTSLCVLRFTCQCYIDTSYIVQSPTPTTDAPGDGRGGGAHGRHGHVVGAQGEAVCVHEAGDGGAYGLRVGQGLAHAHEDDVDALRGQPLEPDDLAGEGVLCVWWACGVVLC